MRHIAANQSFYGSKAWQKTRAAYIASTDGLCESCKARGQTTPGVYVHHKVWLDRRNVSDPSVALAWDNLRLLCHACHDAIHNPSQPMRVQFDADGNAIPPPIDTP